MKNKFALCLTAALILNVSSAHAASVTDQVNAAIASGDFASVKSLLASASPSEIDGAITALLSVTQSSLTSNPDVAVQAMDTAAAFASKVQTADAATIGTEVQKIVNLVSGETKTAKGVTTLLADAETFGQVPQIMAAVPKLYASASLAASNFSTASNPQLAQTPNQTLPSLPPRSQVNPPSQSASKQPSPPSPPLGELPSGQ